MIRQVRKKVASKVAKIRDADEFNFSHWLKKPSIHHHPIEALDWRLADISHLTIDFEILHFSAFSFDFAEPDVFDELKDLNFRKVKSNAVFFMIPVPLNSINRKYEVELSHLSYSARLLEFNVNFPSIKKVQVKFVYNDPVGYSCQIEIPMVYNYLNKVETIIYNIDLHKLEDIVNSEAKAVVQPVIFDKFEKTEINQFEVPEFTYPKKFFRIKIPSIGKYKTTIKQINLPSYSQPELSDPYEFKLMRVKNWFAKFQIPRGDSFLFYSLAEERLKLDTLNDTQGQPSYSKLKEQVKFILSTIKKFDWKKINPEELNLEQYEQAGVRFLAENDYALLQDEFGIDLEREVIAALKVLFNQKIITSALIVSPFHKLGSPDCAGMFNIETGWLDKIMKYCPDLSVSLIQGDNDVRADQWAKSTNIYVVETETVINDHHLRILEDKKLQSIDCIVIDEAHEILTKKEKGKAFISSVEPKIFWAASSLLNNTLQRELNKWLNQTIRLDKVLIRDKASVIEDAKEILVNEFWFEPDEAQFNELKVAMIDCRKDLRRVLESGNPLRFTANIFTLFHRLNQIGNFATGKSKSPKTELLLEHLSRIKSNGKKVLILSQYEKQGVRKIADLLRNSGINFEAAPAGITAEEMKKFIASFNSKSGMVAFITDAKSSKLKFSDLDVSFVIKFDQWWNPILNWELEDVFTASDNEVGGFHQRVNIFQYYSFGTLDQKVRELLSESGLLVRNVFELMQPKVFEELITVDEWLGIFGMPVSAGNKTRQQIEQIVELIETSSEDTFKKILSKFFTVIGYSDLQTKKLTTPNSYSIVGKASRNNRSFFLVARIFSKGKVDEKTLTNILLETSSSRNDKIFIITKGEFPDINKDLIRDNVTLLDAVTLSKYLLRLRIINPENLNKT